MAFLNLLTTVHLPVQADGSSLKNSFGVVIATAADTATATALADLVNLAKPAAEAQNRAHYAREGRLARAWKATASDTPKS